jgi:hypothetical protein
VAQSRLGIDIFGLSYHYQGWTYTDPDGHRTDLSEVNPGAGFAYNLGQSATHEWSIHIGAYRNSFRTASEFAGLAWQWRIGTRFSAGAALLVLHDADGGTRAGPVPLVTFTYRRVALRAILIPSLTEGLSGAIGTFATIRLR